MAYGTEIPRWKFWLKLPRAAARFYIGMWLYHLKRFLRP